MSNLSRLEELLERIVEQNDSIICLLSEAAESSKEIVRELDWTAEYTVANRVIELLHTIDTNTM